MITAKATKPRISMDPNILDFKRKVITSGEKTYPTYMETVVTNMDDKELNWYFDIINIKTNCDNKIFDIIPNKGKLSPYETINIRIQFNPIDPKE